jgi:transcription initiation factor IIE alpha subunit
MAKNSIFYKHKLFKHTDDRDETWYELVWFTDYGTKNQEIQTKAFDTVKQAEKFIKFQENLINYKNFI